MKDKDKHTDYTDNELLSLYKQSGNSVYLGMLLKRYSLLLFGLCMKYLKNEEEARDAVQQVYVKAIHELNKYEVTYFKSWLYIIGKNYCLMQLRNKPIAVEHNEQLHGMAMEEDHSEAMDKHISNERMLSLAEEGLQKLPPPQKDCVTLFYLHKLSYRQIEEQTGYGFKEIKSHIQNGKRNLKIWIEKEYKNHGS